MNTPKQNHFDSVPARLQRRTFSAAYTGPAGVEYEEEAWVRWDTAGLSAGNIFTIDCLRYFKSADGTWKLSCKVGLANIPEHFPELAKYVKWRHATPEGPNDYIAGTLRAASACYDIGHNPGEPKIVDYYPLTREGGLIFKIDDSGKPRPVVTHVEADARAIAASCGSFNVVDHVVSRYAGKDRDFDAARRIAAWPDATDAQLSLPPAELEQLLLRRLPGVRAALRRDIEELGFVW